MEINLGLLNNSNNNWNCMSHCIPKDERQFRVWILNFSNQLLEFGKEFGLKEIENNQLLKLAKSVENDIIKSEMGIGQDLLYKFHKKQMLIKIISETIEKIKNHPNYSPNLYGKKLGII